MCTNLARGLAKGKGTARKGKVCLRVIIRISSKNKEGGGEGQVEESKNEFNTR
jgi:hypothetical protein